MKLIVAFSLYLSMGVYFYTSNAQKQPTNNLMASIGGTAAVQAELTDIYTNEVNGTSLELQFANAAQPTPNQVKIQSADGAVFYPEAKMVSANGVYDISMPERLPVGEYALVIDAGKTTPTSLSFTIAEEHQLARFR